MNFPTVDELLFGKRMTQEEIKLELKKNYAWLGKKYRSVSERRPVEAEIKDLKRLLNSEK